MKLDQLKKVLEPISKIGKDEETFEVLGMKITMRALEPKEEIEVQRYARVAFGDGSEPDQTNTLEYLDRFKIASIAYSVAQIDDLDFRGLAFVETGEVLKNGVAVKVSKAEALIGLMEPWQRVVKDNIYKRFVDLMTKAEDQAEAAVQYEPTDLDAEITRLEERITKLKAQKEEKVKNAKDPRVLAREYALTGGKTKKEGEEEKEEETGPVVERSLADESPEVKEEPPSTTVPMEVSGGTRRGIIPQEAPPPTQEPEPTPEPPAQPPQLSAQRQAPQPQLPPELKGTSVDLGDTGSLVDVNDPEALARAMEEESVRIAQMRERALRAAAAPASPVIPPHRAARDTTVQEGMPVQGAVPVRKPPQASSTLNPNFRPPGRNPTDPTSRG